MHRQVKNPLGTNLIDDARDFAGVLQVQLMEPHIGADGFDAPWLVPGADQQVDLMFVLHQPPCQVRPDKACCPGDDSAFHFRLATTTNTAQPSARTPGMASTNGSNAFMVLASQSGLNIGTNPAKRRHWISPPASLIQRTILE